MTESPRHILLLLAVFLRGIAAWGADDPLASWNEGPTKQAIIEFVQTTTDPSSTRFVPPAERIATFDQDGTLWVEQPIYTQIRYVLDQVAVLVDKRPELKDIEPFKTAIAGNMEAISKLPANDLGKLFDATSAGMSVDDYSASVRAWIGKAKNPRWNRPFTGLTYQPMKEFLQYLRANGYKTYIVTGSGQAFVRVYSEEAYGVPPEQVVGTADATKYGYDKDGKPTLTIQPNLLLNDVFGGKPEGINLIIGRVPRVAAGNSTGDRQMLEYTKAGAGARFAMLVMHDDATREYAYGPAEDLPNSLIGTFTQKLFDEARANGWTVISMKNDWKRVFSFEEK